MNITWLGHGSFRLEIGGEVILIDPWLNGNPMLPDDSHDAAIEGATQILITHGHFDHTADIVAVSKKTGAPVSGIYELAQALAAQGAVEGNAYNKGGTATFGEVTATLVPASHSSSMAVDDRTRYMGAECGFVIRGEGRTLYHSGDTAIMADMDWIGDYFKPEIGILSAGGYYTMDMAQAGYAANRYFDFKTVIPCHYRTFPALEQEASALAAAVPDARVIEPQVMQAIAL